MHASGGFQQSSGGSTTSRPILGFAETTWKVLTRPGRFFRGLPARGPKKGSLLYALVSWFCIILIWIVLGAASNLLSGRSVTAGPLEDMNAADVTSMIVFGVPIMALVAAAFIFLYAALQHLLIVALIRPNSGFGATFQVCAYSFAAVLLSPFLDWNPVLVYLPVAYGVFLVFVGLKVLHDAPVVRAAVAALVPVLASEAFFLLYM